VFLAPEAIRDKRRFAKENGGLTWPALQNLFSICSRGVLQAEHFALKSGVAQVGLTGVRSTHPAELLGFWMRAGE
jgi:hypothetical protein